MTSRPTLSRREFCVAAAGTAAVMLAGCRAGVAPGQSESDPSRLTARPSPPTRSITPGTFPLGLGADRDGFLYVPPSYRPSVPAPLMILLHGAGRSSSEWSTAPLDTMFGAQGIVVLGPDSRGPTWDLGLGGFGPDVAFIDRALRSTYERCNIDPSRVGLGGFSDGASYALSLGITNGDLFSRLIGLSPGFLAPATQRGKPPVFIAHGTADTVLPIDGTSRVFVPQLRSAGYDVTYVEFNGPHAIVVSIVTQAAIWFTTGRAPD